MASTALKEFPTVFELPGDFWASLEITQLQQRHFDIPVPLSEEDPSSSDESDEEESTQQKPVAQTVDITTKKENDEVKLSCRTCKIEFSSSNPKAEQISHFKSTWHIINVRRKVLGRAPLSESEAASSKLRLSREGNKEKLTDSSNSTNQLRKSKPSDPNKIILHTSDHRKISFFKSILPVSPNTSDLSPETHLLQRIKNLSQKPFKYSYFLCGGGYFAAKIYNQQGKSILTKTFRRYTVRKKQGGSQSSRDKQGNAPHSAGASMRRYHEQQLRREIRDLILTWKKNILECDVVFIKASKGLNRDLFFFEGSPFGEKWGKKKTEEDRKVRVIPFYLGRPSMKEIDRAHNILSRIEIVKGGEEEKIEEVCEPEQIEEEENVIEEEEEKNEEEEEWEKEILKKVKDLEQLKENMLDVIRKNDVNELEKLFEQYQKMDEEEDDIMVEVEGRWSGLEDLLYLSLDLPNFEPSPEVCKFLISHLTCLNFPVEHANFQTPLHKAAERQFTSLVHLLLTLGADPTISNSYFKNPYQSSPDRNTREVFRRFAGDANYQQMFNWNWKSINVVPLTDSMEQDKKKKLAEKKQMKKKRDTEKKVLQGLEQKRDTVFKVVEAERNKKVEIKQKMSDREKRAIAAEDRMAGRFNVVTKCENPKCKDVVDYGEIPWVHQNKKYCKETCVKAVISQQIN